MRPSLHSESSEKILRYLSENRGAVGAIPQMLLHGDYNPGNLIIMPNGELGAIDFNCSYGDPCWEIFKVSWRPALFPHFFSGQIQGYFNGEPPLAFWKTYLYYFAYGALVALCAPYWAGFRSAEEGVSVMQDILEWTGNFKSTRPKWYLDDNQNPT